MGMMPNMPSNDPLIETGAMPVLEETYPLIPPFAFALIQTDPISKRTQYVVMESPMNNKEEKAFHFIKDVLIEELDIDFRTFGDKSKAEEYLKRKINKIISDYKVALQPEELDKVMYYLIRDLIGFGKIEPLMRDHLVEDISCDGVGIPIYIWHRKYESIPTNIVFEKEDELDSFVIKLAQRAGRHISIAQPLLDAALEDGSRVQLTFGREVTQRGSTFTIRKFKADPWTITDLIINNTISSEIAAFYWFVMEHRISLLVAGGTAAGKTSLLNALAMLIKPDVKVISIEDTAELNIAQENWIPSVARGGIGETAAGTRKGEITMYDLLRAAMRQRPDYIIVGEIRGEEAYVLFQAMSTGHSGLGTIHGDSVEGVINRLVNKPMSVPKDMLRTLDLIHIQTKVRLRGKFARRCMNITEIIDIDPVTKELLTNKVFQWNATKDMFTYMGRSYTIEKIRGTSGLSEQECWDEIKKRETVLKWMVKKHIRHYRDVSAMIREYYSNPEETFERAKRGLEA